MEVKDLFERQGRRVYRLAMVYLKNPSDAEDAVQNVFLKVLQAKPAFENPDHETAWFLTTTKNYCKDFLKTAWKRRVDYVETPEIAGQDGEEYQILEKVMLLPEKYRELVYLYYYEEYSVKEIAALLKRKESTVQTQLMSARKKLRLLLEREGIAYGKE